MSDSKPKSAAARNGLGIRPEAMPALDPRLSIFAKVAINADHLQGKPPCFHDGMTLEDAVILTGLPRDEAARRIAEWRQDSNPSHYAALRLSEGAGERYLTEPKKAEVIQLCFWGEEYRAAPNLIFRSSLFPSLDRNQKESRRFLDNEEIFCVAGLKIFFTGKQFDQSDLDVYLEILNIARAFPLGTPVKFSAYALLKALGLPMGGNNHARLHKVLIRLCGGVVDATDHSKRYFGQLLHGGIRDELTMNYTVKINPDFAVLFGSNMWSKLDIETRRALGRNQTAKALHAYFSTHINPASHNIETLANLAGVKGKNKKATILKAFEAMKNVGFMDYQPNGNSILPLNISHTPSQARAIIKQAEKPRKPRRRNGPTLAGDLLPHLTPPKK